MQVLSIVIAIKNEQSFADSDIWHQIVKYFNLILIYIKILKYIL